MLRFNKIIALLLIIMLFCSVGLGGCASNAPEQSSEENDSVNETTDSNDEKQLKVALITEGPINDGSWNTSALNGMRDIEKKYGAEIAYSEQVTPESASQVLRTYSREGYDIVFAHGLQFDEAVKNISQEFPDTQFVTVNGTSTGENLYAAGFKYGELGYFLGLLSGMMTKTNQVGWIAPFEAPATLADVETYIQGVEEVNPDCKVSISYIGTWTDIAKAKEASLAQIANGTDILLANGNGFAPGVFQACKEKNIKALGWVDDMSAMAPEVVLTSGLMSVEELYVQMVDRILSGTTERTVALGFKDGAQSLSQFSGDVPQEVVDRVNQAIQDYLDGKIQLKTF